MLGRWWQCGTHQDFTRLGSVWPNLSFKSAMLANLLTLDVLDLVIFSSDLQNWGEIGMLHTSSPSVVPGRRLRLTWPGQLLRCQHGTGCPRALLEGAWH
jgi:hypothetical protein